MNAPTQDYGMTVADTFDAFKDLQTNPGGL